MRRIVTAVLILSSAAILGAQKPKGSPVPAVAATLYNCCDSTGLSFAVESDGAAGSALYSNGTGGVSSILSGATQYEWDLDLTQSSRFFWLTLRPVNGSKPGPFTGSLAFNGQVFSRCFDPGNNVFSWEAIETQDTNCAWRINFTFAGVDYTLVMGPTYPGTGTATVTCTNWTGASCTAWTDAPSAGPNANVADLYSVGKHGDTSLGAYALSFNAKLTRQ